MALGSTCVCLGGIAHTFAPAPAAPALLEAVLSSGCLCGQTVAQRTPPGPEPQLCPMASGGPEIQPGLRGGSADSSLCHGPLCWEENKKGRSRQGAATRSRNARQSGSLLLLPLSLSEGTDPGAGQGLGPARQGLSEGPPSHLLTSTSWRPRTGPEGSEGESPAFAAPLKLLRFAGQGSLGPSLGPASPAPDFSFFAHILALSPASSESAAARPHPAFRPLPAPSSRRPRPGLFRGQC